METGTIALFVFLAAGLVAALYFRSSPGMKDTPLRRIAGLEAVQEAVDRATEMGRPVHYTLGAGEMNADMLASFEILKHVSTLVAERNVPFFVSLCFADQHVLVEQIVKQQYSNAGFMDRYDPTKVRFLGGNKEAYQAAVIALIQKEKPASCFVVGNFLSDALTLAETGYSAGAVQIAGTNAITQVPFFVATCEYTLIGEELYAASAYISRDVDRLSLLCAQEWGKYLLFALILVGSLLATADVRVLETIIAK